jgi:hyperosmotically inducible protein
MLADQPSRSSPSRSADEWVTTQIEALYFRDPAIKARTILVQSLNGVVTLDGEVMTPEERERAVALAESVDGVKNVESRLTLPGEPGATGTSGTIGPIPPGSADENAVENGPGNTVDRSSDEPPTDTALRNDVRARIMADPALATLDINVEVEKGVARLSGDVPDLSARTRAERLARAAQGITEVRNDLVVKR